jgi:hypothetical protein
LIVSDVDNLNDHTPHNLAVAWSEWAKEFSVDVTAHTATVYHFGFSERTNMIHSYAYKSINDFKRILIPYGTHTKPECPVPEEAKFPRDLKLLMDRQRSMQAGLPIEQRVHVGGEIQVIHLTKVGFNVSTLAKFDDFKETEQEIYQNLG